MFRVGDKFICINNEHTGRGGRYTIGKVYTLKRFFSSNTLIAPYDDHPSYGWGPHQISEFNLMFKPYTEFKIEKEEDYYRWLADRNKQ